jgi:hypothetical protein
MGILQLSINFFLRYNTRMKKFLVVLLVIVVAVVALAAVYYFASKAQEGTKPISNNMTAQDRLKLLEEAVAKAGTTTTMTVSERMLLLENAVKKASSTNKIK